jgi:hypothetical protein
MPRWFDESCSHEYPHLELEQMTEISINTMISEYNSLAFPENQEYIESNACKLEEICKHGEWRLLENNMIFFLHVCSIKRYRIKSIFPRKMRSYNRYIIIYQILNFINTQYKVFYNLIRRISYISHYACKHILKYIDFNIKIPDFLIKILSPLHSKQFKFDQRSNWCRHDTTELRDSHLAMQDRLSNSKLHIKTKYKELIAILEAGLVIYDNYRIQEKIQAMIFDLQQSLFLYTTRLV